MLKVPWEVTDHTVLLTLRHPLPGVGHAGGKIWSLTRNHGPGGRGICYMHLNVQYEV
jgi:hypothetical protein